MKLQPKEIEREIIEEMTITKEKRIHVYNVEGEYWVSPWTKEVTNNWIEEETGEYDRDIKEMENDECVYTNCTHIRMGIDEIKEEFAGIEKPYLLCWGNNR
ncbi:hypothetical protein [Clostridium butyricum]|uniref:hypothetical protein n=1 Tax=Clostridium butyricum TaxID=1492 RepID=UPI0009035E0F|nr:hypothetical protein [Clostridium butyricum]APF21534.1 hypothetical protein NPD4_3504 [Clostridium butyricum]DAN05357.1 MAG TPA: Protein of unknown function (DUF1108) [Caudoviricetes sp.]